MNHTRAAHTRTPIASGRRRGRVGGFTLVELMITLAVASVLLTIAVPSFKHVIATSNLASTSNTLVNAIHVARMQAIKRNGEAQFCSNDGASNGSDTLGAACATQAGAVYVATTTSTGATNAVPVLATIVLGSGSQQFDGNVTALRFSPPGLAHKVGQSGPYTGTVADICTDAISSDNHRVVKMIAGSIIKVEHQDGACP